MCIASMCLTAISFSLLFKSIAIRYWASKATQFPFLKEVNMSGNVKIRETKCSTVSPLFELICGPSGNRIQNGQLQLKYQAVRDGRRLTKVRM